MNQTLQNTLPSLLYNSTRLSMVDFLQLLVTEFSTSVTFSTSFSFEDQVITDAIISNNLPIKI
jgi:phosphoadenosine phosphosulfate reductase